VHDESRKCPGEHKIASRKQDCRCRDKEEKIYGAPRGYECQQNSKRSIPRRRTG
jgi:hypothetical protein